MDDRRPNERVIMLRDTRTVITTFTVREFNENMPRDKPWTQQKIIQRLKTGGSQFFSGLTGLDGPSWIGPVGPQETVEWKEEWALMPIDGSEPVWREVED